MNDIIKISTNKSELDIEYIHGVLKTQYWAEGIPRQTVESSIKNSFCFGVYKNQKQIGFARVITDFTIFAYIADVFIDSKERKNGYATQLLQNIVSHEDLKGIRRWHLLTKDAHRLYEKIGFSTLADSSRHMEKTYKPNYSSSA